MASKKSGRNRPGRVRGSKSSPSVKLHRSKAFIPAPPRPPLGPITLKALPRPPVVQAPRPDDRRMRQPDGKKSPPKRLDGRPATIIHSRAPRREGRIFRPTAQKKRFQPLFKTGSWSGLEKTDGRHESYRFVQPHKVWVCVKRKVRREVLHALGRQSTGRGFGRRKPASYSAESAIHC